MVINEICYPACWTAIPNVAHVPNHPSKYLLRTAAVLTSKPTLQMALNSASYVRGKIISLVSTMIIFGFTFILPSLGGDGYFKRTWG